MANELKADSINISLTGRIDSVNASDVEKDIMSQLFDCDQNTPIVFNAEKLDYISSAGLRVILRVKKLFPNISVENVNSDIYDTFEMTGFVEMMTIKKAYRVVSVEGCEVIGEGFNGKVYRIDKDNVVKTYKNADALSEIQYEREVARLALILGVPTAISYDVVRVGDSYGSVFELLNAKSFSKLLAEEPDKYGFCVKEYVNMLKKMHSITVPEGKLPSIKEKTLRRIDRIRDYLPNGLGDKLFEMAKAIPDSDKMVHGDFHTKNIVLTDDEVLVIDMDTLSVGDPVFEFLHMYKAYVGYSEYDPSIVQAFQGYSSELARKFWHDVVSEYFGTKDEKVITEIDEKVRCLAYPDLLDWSVRHIAEPDEKEKATRELWLSRLIELLNRVDSLDISKYLVNVAAGSAELEIEATTENLQTVINYVEKRLDLFGCPQRSKRQIALAVEEVFVNIASYAYASEIGKAVINVDASGDPITATISIKDSGVPYDPLKKPDPDITLSAEERSIGGLGIFMTKKLMNDVLYEYKDGKNILTLKKIL